MYGDCNIASPRAKSMLERGVPHLGQGEVSGSGRLTVKHRGEPYAMIQAGGPHRDVRVWNLYCGSHVL